jgi:hypothetical protein
VAKAKKKGSSAVVTVDWRAYHKREKKREKEGGSGQWLKRVKEGDYPFTIKAVKLDQSKAGNTMFVVTFVGKSGKVKNKQTRDYFTFTAEALFKLVQLLEAIGEDVPEDTSRIDGASLVGKDVGITLEDEEYDGKMTSKAQGYVPIEDLVEDGDEDDDEPDIDSMDLDTLVKFAKKNKIKVKGLKTMKLKKARKAVSDAVDVDEDLEAVDLDDV